MTRDAERGLIHIAFTGTLTVPTAPLAQATLIRCLAEQPVAVVIDVGDLLCRSHVAVPLFLALRRRSRRPPAVPLIVLAPRNSNGSTLRAALGRYLPTRATMAEVWELVGRLPSADRWCQVRLSPTPAAPGRARATATDCCLRWDLPPLLFSACTAVSELVANGVEHAGTELWLTLTVRPHFLCGAVRDGSPVLPRPVERLPHEPGAVDGERGYGLRTLAKLVHSWGAAATADGKVVWFALADPGPRPAGGSAVGRRAGRYAAGRYAAGGGASALRRPELRSVT